MSKFLFHDSQIIHDYKEIPPPQKKKKKQELAYFMAISAAPASQLL
jgi:hypothetical protein